MTWAVIPTAHAMEQAAEIEAWWQKHRTAAPDLFQAEVADVLPRTRYLVYYVTDEAKREVTIMAFWGAPRGSPPDFG